MIKYEHLVEYTKKNHIKWSTDLFDVLRGFFESLGSMEYSQSPAPLPSEPPTQEDIIFPKKEFHAPKDGEYTTDDLLDLFST